LTILGPVTVSRETVLGNLPPETDGLFRDTMFPELWQAAEDNGIRPEGMVAQAGKETAWGQYPGRVRPWFYNTAGIKVAHVGEVVTLLGTSDGDHPLVHQQFPSWRVGAIAHAQHLLAYVGNLPEGLLVDPRFWLVTTPPVTTWAELGGRWAPSPTYGQEIQEIIGRLGSNA